MRVLAGTPGLSALKGQHPKAQGSRAVATLGYAAKRLAINPEWVASKVGQGDATLSGLVGGKGLVTQGSRCAATLGFGI
jgi:hypothetical protein